MSIKIYGVPLSQNVRKPLAVAAHIGVEVENPPVRPIDDIVQQKSPSRRVPFMVDADVVLCESNAIMIHLCSRKPNNLYPEERTIRDRINQFLFWDAAHWTPAYQPIQFERLVKKILGMGDADENVVAATLVKFEREAGYLNSALDGREWLAGDAPTLADFAVGCGLTHAKSIDLPLSDYPNIEAWNARVVQLEGFRKTAV
ncbi:MAG: glutathione S-transferase family protein [Parvularculaceae bacterium]|nr:glutathione S-transferase family protein [Parvularculaceae bacterium]